RELYLQLRFGRARTCSEDVEDELRAIHDACRQRILEVLALRGRELLVEYDEPGTSLLDQFAQLCHLAFADEVLRVGRVESLSQCADDIPACRIYQPAEFLQVLRRFFRRDLLERRCHQNCPLPRGFGRYRAIYGRSPVRVCQNNVAASPAQTPVRTGSAL